MCELCLVHVSVDGGALAAAHRIMKLQLRDKMLQKAV